MDTNFFFSRDSEAALGSQSATMGGSFWSRIRLGKAVAGPGVRGQDDRDKWTQSSPMMHWGCVCVSALLLVRGSAAGAAALKCKG